MGLLKRWAVTARFVAITAIFNVAWFAMSWPRYSFAVSRLIGGVLLLGQGLIFSLSLWTAANFGRVAISRISWRSFLSLTAGQPLIVLLTGTVEILFRSGSRTIMTDSSIVLASILGAVLLALCMRWETGRWVQACAAAMILTAGAWGLLPGAIQRGWAPLFVRTGALGSASSRMFHPFVTAAWQVPMAALVAWWLVKSPANQRAH